MPIETSVVGSDGWWLARLYNQLRQQRRECEKLWERYEGNPPLPVVNKNQAEATRWFITLTRTNFERLIVAAVLSRLKIRGIRTAADDDEGGDAEAYALWKGTGGKNWSREAHKYALTMRKGYVVVGMVDGQLLVTAEDPRQFTAVTDPATGEVVAALKLYYDDVEQQDVAVLFLPGRVRRATKPRTVAVSAMPPLAKRFQAANFNWSVDWLDDAGNLVGGEEERPDWLQERDGKPARVPVVVVENEDGLAEFEPFIPALDRINKQILDRMTIATIQAFKQRAMKGLPQKDPKTGEAINYDDVFASDPGAIWNVPASVEIWESGQVDLQPILLAIRDDIRDLAAVSGTPLYTITPDLANGSAEGASLQRETLTFKVEHRQDKWERSHETIAELIFLTAGDDARAADRTKIEVLWAPGDRPSMSERANAIAQTKGVVPRYIQLTEIWGFDPATADRAMSMLQQDAKLDMAQAAAAQALGQPDPTKAAPGKGSAPRPQSGELSPGQSGKQ